MSSLEIVTEVSASNSEGSKEVTALCAEAGEQLSAISGGARITGSTVGVALVATHPNGIEGEVPGGWTARAEEIDSQPENWRLTAYVLCADVD